MARLNEPPAAPVESIEALKRRFVRQNREIARANSTQSLRIRNLEAETSRLLSENLVLREQVINLQHELDSRPGKALLEEVGLIKDKLEIKLAELGGLVFDLGRTQKTGIAASSPSRRRSRRMSPKRSPDQRNWRNALTLSEVTGGQDGRLPPIVEDKYFPRRTLDPEDILGILSDPANSDSPDLGPPPIAHFDDGDPIKYDTSQHAKQNDGVNNTFSGFANLETRKKRRESSFGKEPGSSLTLTSHSTSREESSSQTGTLSAQPLKIGAKRKLSARDDDGHVDAPARGETDDFRFNRITEGAIVSSKEPAMRDTSVATNPSARKIAQDLATARGGSRPKTSDSSVLTTSRKVLGEKTVNTDPVVSPAKPSRAALPDRTVELKKDLPPKKSHDRDRDRDPSRPRIRPSATTTTKPIPPAPHPSEPTPTPISIAPPDPPARPPATPIHPDLLSPLPSEPSAPTARPGHDTPPPPDLHPDASTTTTLGRASRHPRGSISYAEPNLRAKMRRPTKDLVDAVPGAADERGRAASVRAASETRAGGSEPRMGGPGEEKAVRTVVIKRESVGEEGGGWRTETGTEPGSPLERKSEVGGGRVGGLPASVLTERRRRVSGLGRDEAGEEGVGVMARDGVASAVQALVVRMWRKEREERDRERERGSVEDGGGVEKETETCTEKETERAKERSGGGDAGNERDAYDFHGSESETDARIPPNARPDPKPHARARHHDGLGSKAGSGSGSLPPTDKIRVSRRVSSVAEGLGKGDAGGVARTGDALNPPTGSRRGRKRRDTLAGAGGDGDAEGKEEGGVEKGMGMRAVGRRRSMMV